jgi:glycosyltransferase involved in cell wall biosynthesis
MPVLRLKDVHRMQRWESFKVNKTWQYINDVGRFEDFTVKLGPFHGVKNAWRDEPCVVVGAGPSLKGFDLDQLNGVHTIGINHVIEDYDGFEYLLFLDNRFINKTTYDLSKFKGTIFQSNKCQMLPDNDVVRFKPKGFRDKITLNIEDGLFNGSLSALCALHLAIITGANPIYLIGLDCGGPSHKDYHYKPDYNGAVHTLEKLNKYIGTAGFFNHFKEYKDRIKNISKISNIKTFQKVDMPDFNKLKYRKKKKQATICHVIKMNDMESMGDISRQVYNQSYGNHIYCRLGDRLPKADIYLLECFINGWNDFYHFQKPLGSKVVSLIHSSGNCQPAKCSDQVITITDSWREVVKRKFRTDSTVIHAGIDTSIYTELPDYTKKSFGRITRYSRGKVHPEFNNVCKNILAHDEENYGILFTSNNPAILKHERLIIDDTIKINEHEKKANKLKELTIFADMHNTFVETFSLCLLEAMAAGLCIVLYSEVPQPAMREILGNTGILCKSVGQFEGIIKELLPDADRKKEFGLKARERAKEFTVDKMIKKYDRVFKGLL